MEKQKTRKLYYAHCMAIYNTPQETRDLELLQKLFPNHEIINPNNPEFQEECKKIGMEYFKEKVIVCDLLVFRGLPYAKIPAGIAKEIVWADEYFIPVIELPCFTGREMSVEDTRSYLKEIGQR